MKNNEIGNRIKYARSLRNDTLDNIAKKVGVAKSTIQRYENGKIGTVKLPVIESIAIALNVNPAWIIGKSNDMELPVPKTPKIIEYYTQLNDIGKIEATKRVEELTYLPQYTKSTKEEKVVVETPETFLKAAHERNDIEVTNEMRKHDDNIMDDDEFWK